MLKLWLKRIKFFNVFLDKISKIKKVCYVRRFKKVIPEKKVLRASD